MSSSIYSPEEPTPYLTDEPTPDSVTKVVSPDSQPPAKRKPRKLLLLVLLTAAAVTAWLTLGASKSIDSRDLGFLPDDPNVVLHFEAARLVDSELFNDLKQLSEQALIDHAPNGSTDLLKKLEDSLETITIGIKAPDSLRSGKDPEVAGVMRFRQDLLLQDVIPVEFKTLRSGEEDISGRSMQVYDDGAYCQIDERTIAFGDPIGMRKILERDLEDAALSEDMKDALSQADFTQLLTVVAAGKPASIEELKPFIGFDLPKAIVVNADVAQDIDVTASVVMQSKADIDALKSKAQPFLEMAKMKSAEAASAIESLEFSTSGTTLTVSVTIPGPPLLAMAKEKAKSSSGQLVTGAVPVSAPGTSLRVPHSTSAGEAACKMNLAEMNAAIERYYFEFGSWPTDLDALAKQLSLNFPRSCRLHGKHYAIDADSHKAIETISVPTPKASISTSPATAETEQHSSDLLGPAASPREAFDWLLQAATEGDALRLLDCFTVQGQLDIVQDLTDSAVKDIATRTYETPSLAEAFQAIKAKAPHPAGATESLDQQADLRYLRAVAAFMQEHRIEFSELAKMYGPCELGAVVVDGDWAVGDVKHDNDGVVTKITLGFADQGGWHVCSSSELPAATFKELKKRLVAETPAG